MIVWQYIFVCGNYCRYVSQRVFAIDRAIVVVSTLYC